MARCQHGIRSKVSRTCPKNRMLVLSLQCTLVHTRIHLCTHAYTLTLRYHMCEVNVVRPTWHECDPKDVCACSRIIRTISFVCLSLVVQKNEKQSPSVLMFHGTPSIEAVDKILAGGFILPDDTNIPYFGQGVFTAISSSKASHYAAGKKSDADTGYILIVEVKIGNYEPPTNGMNR
jgi:hypothetical protein